MTYYPDLGQQSMVASGEHVRAVGWLNPDYPFATGNVSADFLDRLKTFARGSGPSGEALYFGLFAGIHTCEFCEQSHGLANFGVPDGTLLYVCPEMVVHYIERHNYLPPPAFVEAVLRSPLPDTEEYRRITEPFRKAHQAAVERSMRGYVG